MSFAAWSHERETARWVVCLSFHQQAVIPTEIKSTSPIMSRKRKQPDLDLEPVFNKFFAAANASEGKEVIVKFLKAIKIQLESAPSTKPRKLAKSFTLEEAVDYFSLTYKFTYSDSVRFHWKIETLPDVKEMQPSTCLCSFFP